MMPSPKKLFRYGFLALCVLLAAFYFRAQEHSESEVVPFDVSGLTPEYSGQDLVTLTIRVDAHRVIRTMGLQREKAGWIREKVGPKFPAGSVAKANLNRSNISFLWGNTKEDYFLSELLIDGQPVFNCHSDEGGPGAWTFFLVLFLFFLLVPFVQGAAASMSPEERKQARHFDPYTAIFRKEFWKARIHVTAAVVLIAVTALMAAYEFYLWKKATSLEGVVTEILPPVQGSGFYMLNIDLKNAAGKIVLRADRAEMRNGHKVGAEVKLLYNPHNPGADYIFDSWYAIWSRTLCLGLVAALMSIVALILCVLEFFSVARGSHQ